MIEIKNVSKKYGKREVIHNMNLAIKDNEIIGLLGENGAGKSTTLNMITGLIDVSAGEITINGYDISKNPKQAKREIGYMPENAPVYLELTPKEFLRYMAELNGVKKDEIEDRIEKVSKQVNIKEVENKIIKILSKGYRQRISLAGALVKDAKVIILDEPMSGLDPKQIMEFRSLIKELKKEHTVVISSHILSEISQICDRVIILQNGRILASDTPENLEKQMIKENIIYLRIEDKQNKIEELKREVSEIKNITLEDEKKAEKVYKITFKDGKDYRKRISGMLTKLEIPILEIKQVESTLEDAFLNIIDQKEAKGGEN